MLLSASKQLPQGKICSVETTHSVNTSSGRSRGRAYVNVLERSTVRNWVYYWSRTYLPQIVRTPVYGSVYQIRVTFFQVSRRSDLTSDDAFRKTGRKASDLCLNQVQHVERRTAWNVTV